MLPCIVDFANILLAALLAGSVFTVWLLLNPAGLDASQYVVLQQQAIRKLNVLLPLMGAAVIVLTLITIALEHTSATRLLLIGALAGFVVSALITRFGNQPINAVVIAWKPEAPPANWTAFRDRWWLWHRVRVVTMCGGFLLLLSAALFHATPQ